MRQLHSETTAARTVGRVFAVARTVAVGPARVFAAARTVAV